MISVEFSSDFVRTFKKLSVALRSEIKEKIEEFKDPKNHSRLKVHKLQGRMKGSFAFSVNFSYRVIFEWSKNKKTAYLFDVGNHSIYE